MKIFLSKVQSALRHRYAKLIFALGMAIFGALAVWLIRAATPTASFETENGTITAPAQVYGDGTASGAQAVEFRAPSGPSYWKPSPGMTWQWQLTGTIDTSVNAQVFDVDLFNTDASVVAALHSQGKKVLCYMETGGWESYRPDAPQFPASVLGGPVDDYPEERYLDVRRIDLLGPVMRARLDLCKQKGFDGVEPDLDDTIFQGPNESNITGFPITYQDMINYNKFIADEAHKRGLSIGLKNGVALGGQFARDMEPFVDFALIEQCAQYDECDAALPFVAAGKAVFVAEYRASFTTCADHPKAFAAASNPAYSSYRFILKQENLGAKRAVCP